MPILVEALGEDLDGGGFVGGGEGEELGFEALSSHHLLRLKYSSGGQEVPEESSSDCLPLFPNNLSAGKKAQSIVH